MKAKDTVMSAGKLCTQVCQEYRALHLEGKNCDGEDCEVCQLTKQAEISFKAGMKEVVDTYRQENPSSYNKYKVYWIMKQKDWGIWEE